MLCFGEAFECDPANVTSPKLITTAYTFSVSLYCFSTLIGNLGCSREVMPSRKTYFWEMLTSFKRTLLGCLDSFAKTKKNNRERILKGTEMAEFRKRPVSPCDDQKYHVPYCVTCPCCLTSSRSTNTLGWVQKTRLHGDIDSEVFALSGFIGRPVSWMEKRWRCHDIHQ